MAAVLIRRLRILSQLVAAGRDEKSLDTAFLAVREQYGDAEVDYVLAVLRRQANELELLSANLTEEHRRTAYRNYVSRFRRFGSGGRPLTIAGWTRIAREHAELTIKLGSGKLPPQQRARLDQVSEMLLFETMFWDDLIPDDLPADVIKLPRPEE
jgi:hypothetical protein